MRDLDFYNGFGGFAPDGLEYVIGLRSNQETPAPWINVVSNPRFGFQVSAEGSGYTWSVNSKENQLTPWSNDPVGDRPAEVFYVRDEETGELWGPTALPVRIGDATYRAYHGHGYSRFEHASHGVSLELVQVVPLADSIKISRLRLSNHSRRTRRLSVTAYVEWVLGSARMPAGASIVTSIDPDTRALLARNPRNSSFGERVAFVDLCGLQTHWTGDRLEFLGRHGTLSAPAALKTTAMLSGRVGAALDPCGTLQTSITLEPGESIEVVFLLGDAATPDDARALVLRYRATDVDTVLREVATHWESILGAVQVRTPDRGFDLMLNSWLLYQTIACRIWARSAFYQASGAYGFRDQLQDGLALITAAPALTREHLLRAAARQFVEGDVQHWWLPHSGQGVRTRISDDRVWLGYCIAQYVKCTGDIGILSESVPFLEGQSLGAAESDAFFVPSTMGAPESLYEHGARALDQSLAVGLHGLPLMGTGDWNDGLNRVGEGGLGESVWLAWLLRATLLSYSSLAVTHGEPERAANWIEHVHAIDAALEANAWDGSWYRRAYYDDGTPLGSSVNSECRIDSIAQSWAVIGGGINKDRAAQGMTSVQSELISRRDGLALLFAPPFDRTVHDPGYIKGYPPGLRENGGQYTHAAAWSVIALAQLGRGDAAHELFSILSPISHSLSREAVRRYKVEPYVVAADIYSVAPHVGRGGWTWYTGSAGWLYQAGLGSIIGLRVEGSALILDPCLPRSWELVEVRLKHRSTRYDIRIENPNAACNGIGSLFLDGALQRSHLAGIPLVDDGGTHLVRAILGPEDHTSVITQN